MTDQAIPDTPELPIDAALLAELIHAALVRARLDFADVDVRGASWIVFRELALGRWGDVQVPGPGYQNEAVWARTEIAERSPEAVALTAYLWANGRLKTTLSGVDGNPLGQDAWAGFAWNRLVFTPLLGLLNLQARRSLVAAGLFEPWALPQDMEVKVLADRLARHVATGNRTVRARCLMGGFAFSHTGTGVDLGNGAVLRSLDVAGLLVVIAEDGGDVAKDFGNTASAPVTFEMTIEVQDNHEAGDEARDRICTMLDQFKWALSMVAPECERVWEGPIVFHVTGGTEWWPPLRRDSLPIFKRVQILRQTIEECRGLIARLKAVGETWDDFNVALWHLGRAYLSALNRDSILETVIGLETLLVADAGETRYKFTLHGSAVIGDEKAVKILEDLYGARSGAAHGGKKQRQPPTPEAAAARLTLGRMIMAALMLCESGELSSTKKARLGDAVKALVRRRAARK